MAKTIAEVLVESLVKAGVRRIHGLVGDSLNAISDVVRKTEGIEWIHYRHEEAAAFAAGAEAQLTGQLAVCAGSCGPGNLHLINGLYDCNRSMAPVLAIAAHIPSGEIGTTYFQETHPERLFQECSQYCELISSARQMPRVLQLAMQYAVGKRGVGVIVLPGDVAMEKVDDTETVHGLFYPKPVIHPADAELDQMASLLNDAKNVTLFCGAGCAGAHADLLALGERLKSPMVYALRGKEHVEPDNSYAVGMTGLIGTPSGYRALEKADVILLLGTDFPYKVFYPKDAKIIQVDIRPERIGSRTHVELGVVGDIAATIQKLLPKLTPKTDDGHLKTAQKQYASTRKSLDEKARFRKDDHPIHPEYVTAVINELAPSNTIFTCDVGTPTVWAARYLTIRTGQRLISSFSHGSMASAMPQAIGAQLTFPDRPVVSLSGDGGFAMMMGDFLTIVQYKLPVKIVIYNNSSLGFVAMEQKVGGIPPFGTDLVNPNFAKLAEAVGIKGIRVETAEEVRPAIEAAFAHNGPVLIDAVVNPDELAMPPKITLDEAWGFNVYMLRETIDGHGDSVLKTLVSNFL